MRQEDIDKLQSLADFPSLVAYLRDELGWPLDVVDAEEVTFDYDPSELGIDPKHAVKIESIRQIRPLVDDQPWAIFYIEFESRRLPVVVLRRILRTVVHSSRQRDPDRPAWRMDDLLFISAQGEEEHRSISFAHFQQRKGRVAELRTFSWDSRESHFYYLKNLNLEALRWPEDESDADTWRDRWRQAFTVEHRYVIRKSQELARQLAYHAAMVRELVDEVFELETEEGPLHRLHESFKATLLHDLRPREFADMVAQTVAYGLFSARTQSGELTYDRMVELIPDTNPFLRDLLAELTSQGAVDLEELGIGQLVELLSQTDVEAILQDFGRRTGAGREDPVVHFYELFLREYDSEQKVKRGVFYTPDPVVSYIVRSVDALLRTEFGLQDGLADTSINVESGEPLVQILDPAVGTGTFLVHVIDEIERTVSSRTQLNWSKYVADHLLPRLYGFELMMAPYAVGHMKLGLKLQQTGYNFASGERLRVYLTNSLEKPVEMDETLGLAGFLSKESNEAARVKRQASISVIIGNPPYSVSSANKGPHIEQLMDRYKEAVRHEQNIQPLSDDYIKFIRFGHDCIERTGYGVIGMITNHSYLSGLIHRGVREELMKSFSKIYVLDLHGHSGDMSPDGGEDENVFDIRQGVAISFLVKEPNDRGAAEVRYAEIWGDREGKYAFLQRQDTQTTEWQLLEPLPPSFYFVPRPVDFREEYEEGWPLTQIFPANATGFTTHRDQFVTDFEEEALRARLALFRDEICPDEEVSSRFGIESTESWNLSEARRRLRSDQHWQAALTQCLYRPFDVRTICYHDSVIDRSRRQLMRHMLRENLALVAMRQVVLGSADYTHFFVSRWIVDNRTFLSNRGRCSVMPVYLHAGDEAGTGSLLTITDGARVPNLSPGFVSLASQALRLKFVPQGVGDLLTTFGPEDVLHYAYAVFHSPTYRERYSEFLKIDFPRLPITSDTKLFSALTCLGADLVALHLMQDGYPSASWNRAEKDSPLQHPFTRFVEGANYTMVGAVSKGTCYQDGRVYLDTSRPAESSYFDGVPEDVWQYQIGGYQVCHKWLYDRRGKRGQPGRTLTQEDIAHYQRVVVAIKETIRLMREIDEVIDAHGGWPIE